MVLVGLASCTDFDGPVTEQYGPAPSIEVTITPGTQTDNEFTVTIKPDASALYYAFAIGRSAEPQALDSATLYKGGYGNDVVKVSAQPDTTITITTAAPNTTYQVYAVAGSKEGIISSVVVKSITTTDAGVPAPVPDQWAQGAEEKAVAILFSENVSRGEGAVKATYYKEWDWDNTVELTADDIVVEIEGQIIQLSAPKTPAGAIVLFSWEEGAFVDAKGNKCPAFTTTYDEEEDDFIGYWVQNQKVAFEIADDYVTPASGTPIGAWEDFEGTITFPFDIYRIDDDVKKGDIQLTYTNGDRQVVYNLTADQWEVEGNKLVFDLPAEPTVGDMVVFSIQEGIVFDVYGNPNAAYSSSNIELKYAGFVPTEDMVIGNFDFTFTSAYDGELYDGGVVTIEKTTEIEGHEEDGIYVSNLFDGGYDVEGHMDLAKGKVIVDAFQLVGESEYQGAKIYLVLYNVAQTDEVAFTINSNGTLTSNEVALVAYNEDLTSALGWWEKCSIATLTPKANGVSALKTTKAFKKISPAVARNLKQIRK